MRYFLCLFIFMLFAKSSFSQNVVVYYESERALSEERKAEILKKNAALAEVLAVVLNEKQTLLLSHRQGVSHYTTEGETAQRQLTTQDGSQHYLPPKNPSPRVFKNINQQRMRYLFDHPSGGVYVKDALHTSNWEIQADSTREIAGYTCQYAKGKNLYGNTVHVWFAPDIPISDGPEDLHGLPGLILEAQTRGVRIRVTKITFPETLTISPPETALKPITLAKFREQQERLKKKKTRMRSEVNDY